jgi:diguanylate cyclase (GGDEF)-like protein
LADEGDVWPITSPASRVQRGLAPFIAVQLVAFGLVSFADTVDWSLFSAALVLTLLAPGPALLANWKRLAGGAHLLSALLLLVGAALLRHASGQPSSGVGVLSLLPVFWVALHASRVHLAVVLAAVGLFFVVPVLTLGGGAHPAVGLGVAGLFIATGAIVAVTVQRLVAEGRRQLQLAQAREVQMAVLAREREEMFARLQTLAVTDALTGVGNRRAWDEWLAEALSSSRRDGQSLVVAMLDLDHFKAFNDRCGHQRGDDLLADAAANWRAVLRPSDRLARYGGEEFAVLLPHCTLEPAAAVVERLRKMTPDGQTCSVGLAQWDGAETADDLVQRADAALYRAKAEGRDRAHIAPARLTPAHVAPAPAHVAPARADLAPAQIAAAC